LQHVDFLKDPDSRHYDWRLKNWSSAVRIALGGKALLLFRSALVVLLAPAAFLAAYSLYSNRPELLVLVFLSCWGFWTSSTGPTGIGMAATMFTAITGFVFSVIMQDKLLAFSCVLPGVTWIGACAILGTTASYMTDALRKSEGLFQTLLSRGIMVAMEVAEQSHPALGPDSHEESSPPAP